MRIPGSGSGLRPGFLFKAGRSRWSGSMPAHSGCREPAAIAASRQSVGSWLCQWAFKTVLIRRRCHLRRFSLLGQGWFGTSSRRFCAYLILPSSGQRNKVRHQPVINVFLRQIVCRSQMRHYSVDHPILAATHPGSVPQPPRERQDKRRVPCRIVDGDSRYQFTPGCRDQVAGCRVGHVTGESG